MSSQHEFDEPSVICAAADEPGLLYPMLLEKGRAFFWRQLEVSARACEAVRGTLNPREVRTLAT